MENRQYPIGKFEPPAVFTPEIIAQWIDEIEALPRQVESVVKKMSEAQLDTAYRTGGWSARQVVHHIADSHMNAYIRVRLALTEDNPTAKSYSEELWAELSDARTAPVQLSIDLLAGLHTRWALLLRSLTPEQLKRTLFVPYFDRHVAIEYIIGMYAWHGKHHLEHIKLVK